MVRAMTRWPAAMSCCAVVWLSMPPLYPNTMSTMTFDNAGVTIPLLVTPLFLLILYVQSSYAVAVMLLFHILEIVRLMLFDVVDDLVYTLHKLPEILLVKVHLVTSK